MPKILIEVGEELFQFSSFDNWCDTAKSKFRKANVRGQDVICLDSRGRICVKGLEFMRAARQKTFPLRVFDKLC